MKDEKKKGPMIFSKIIDVMKEIKSIGKVNRNEQQGFLFRGIDDMYNAVHPLFQKHGIFITSEITNHAVKERKTAKGGDLIHTYIDARFTFYAEDGSSVQSFVKGEAMDTGDKGTNKAMSVALKYALVQMFLIPTKEGAKMDPDATSYEAKTEPGPKPKKEEKKKETTGEIKPEELKQIGEELQLLNSEREVWDYAWQWPQYQKNNLVFKGLLQKRVGQLPKESLMTAEEKSAYRRPKLSNK